MNQTSHRDYLFELLKINKREDGRGLLDYRNISIEVNPIKRAHGSARIKLGDTDVFVGVKLDVGTPFPDTPDQGVLMIGSELLPLASAEFEAGPPHVNSIELARVIDRLVRESKMIDLGKLCVKKGEKVWMVFVDIYPINASGNLFDAAALGAVVALHNTKLPKYDAKSEKVMYEEPTNVKLPVSCKPLMTTFGKIGDKIFVDFTEREQNSIDARISVGTLENGNVCAMQKGGEGTFTQEEVLKIVGYAADKGKQLRRLVK